VNSINPIKKIKNWKVWIT